MAFASVARKSINKELVTERMAKGFSGENSAEAAKKIDARKFRFVKRVRQGTCAIYVYRTEGDEAEVLWFLFDPSGKMANLGSFPIMK